jgi:4-carboxymuconolactone decarboxylase
MARLPDLGPELPESARAVMERMAATRAHAEATAHLGGVYLALFHDPGVAEKIGDLGEQLRFHGVLADDVRELVILRYAAGMRFAYEWSHHQRAARQAGLDEPTIEALAAGEVPASLRSEQRAALAAVDAVIATESIPAEVQDVLVERCGPAGAVEVIALCGLYAIMGYVVTAFDVPLEEGLPPAPFGTT